MGKKLFILLVVLMSLSLIGIIFVQSFFINNSLENEENNFTLSVKRALSFVSRDIEATELRNYYVMIQPLIAEGKEPDSTVIQRLYVTTQDDVNDKTIIHRNTVLEERFKVPSLFFEIDADSITISNLTNERVTEIYSNTSLDGNVGIKPQKTLVEYSSLPELRKQLYEDTFKTLLKEKNIPIYNRVSTEQIETLLKRELKDEGVNLNFEFAIYDDDLATKVQTENFEKENSFGIPVFLDNNNEGSYRLWVDFPDRKKYLLSSILWMILLSILFTSIIIIAYSSAI